MDFTRVALDGAAYLYVERECPYGPEIAEAMGSAFGEVFGFVGQAGITPLSAPMSLYLGMDPKVLRFRGGVMVSEEDAAKASSPILVDHMPKGEAMMATHVGPYDRMDETHQAMWAHMEAEGISGAMPVWELYVDDPTLVAPDAVRTEIYCTIG